MMQTLIPSKNWVQNSYSAGNKFNLALSDHNIAGQIARLLNANNKLTTSHNASSILNSPIRYFIELYGQTVLGCIGLSHESRMDKIVHISVARNARKMGIAKHLLELTINSSQMDVIYMHIREDNAKSKSLVTKMGFNIIAYIPKFNYNILTFCLFRRNNVGRN